jgi:hypothetical protein
VVDQFARGRIDARTQVDFIIGARESWAVDDERFLGKIHRSDDAEKSVNEMRMNLAHENNGPS